MVPPLSGCLFSGTFYGDIEQCKLESHSNNVARCLASSRARQRAWRTRSYSILWICGYCIQLQHLIRIDASGRHI